MAVKDPPETDDNPRMAGLAPGRILDRTVPLCYGSTIASEHPNEPKGRSRRERKSLDNSGLIENTNAVRQLNALGLVPSGAYMVKSFVFNPVARFANVIVRKFPIEHLDPITLLGQNDANLRQIERALPVRITLRDGTITVAGEDDAVGSAARALEELVGLAESGKIVEEADVATALGIARRNGSGGRLAEAYEGAPGYAFDRQGVRARTPTQAEYLKALEENDVVFAIGPAGTGKTYLAVAAAVHALRQKKVDRIILVRPAVEAGESLGFLPGDMQEKVDPYLRPMYDALADLMSYDKMRRYIELGVIEIAPLAFMRGRTLHSSLRDPRRGAEHHGAPDEDVPHPHGRELARGDHRRRHPDRPARPGNLGAGADPGDPRARFPTSSSSTSIPRTWSVTAWCARSSGRSTSITRARTATTRTASGRSSSPERRLRKARRATALPILRRRIVRPRKGLETANTSARERRVSRIGEIRRIEERPKRRRRPFRQPS